MLVYRNGLGEGTVVRGGIYSSVTEKEGGVAGLVAPTVGRSNTETCAHFMRLCYLRLGQYRERERMRDCRRTWMV